MTNYVYWKFPFINESDEEFEFIDSNQHRFAHCKSKVFFVSNTLDKGFIRLIEINKVDSVYFYEEDTISLEVKEQEKISTFLDTLSCFCSVRIFKKLQEKENSVHVTAQGFNRFWFETPDKYEKTLHRFSLPESSPQA